MNAPRTLRGRLMAFNAVGCVGFGVQVLALWMLVRVADVPYLPATALAVELAVAHNFICHWCWTWSDRITTRRRGTRAGTRPGVPRDAFGRFVRFNATNGAVSLVVNVGLMWLLQGVFGLHYLLANVVGVACSSGANFLLGDRVVFAVRA